MRIKYFVSDIVGGDMVAQQTGILKGQPPPERANQLIEHPPPNSPSMWSIRQMPIIL